MIAMSIGSSINAEVRRELERVEPIASGMELSINIKVMDKDKNVVRELNVPGNSFLMNFMYMVYAVLTFSNPTVKDTSGSPVPLTLYRVEKTVRMTIEDREINYDRYQAGFIAWANKEDDSHGILIGSGTKIVDPKDYTLSSKIPHGIGSGKVLYLSCSVGSTEVTGDMARLTISRSFLNHSGSDITVTELGLAVRQFNPETNILLIRDQIPAVTVPNDYTLYVTYSLVVSV